MEFVGTYYHTLDIQGRVSVPKKFRHGLSEGSIVTKGLDGCLFIFSAEYWSEMSTKLHSLPMGNKLGRDFLRLMTYSASPIEFDSLGRTRFPQTLAEAAELTKEVVFVGTLTRIEVWDKQRYHDYYEALVKREDEIAAAAEGFGV